MFNLLFKKRAPDQTTQYSKPSEEKDVTITDNKIVEELREGHQRTFHTKYAEDVDAEALEEELKKNIIGEVRFDEGSRAIYSTDASNYRQIPIGVVIPKSEQDIITTVALCKKYNSPVLSRGGGTSLAGQCCNVAVVMDFSKYYNKVLNIDKEKKLVTVQTGIVLDAMRHATETEAKLTFGPDPATHSHNTIGGMLGNNSCGVHSIMSRLAGKGSRTSDNLESMVVLTYDGVKMKVGPTSDTELEQIIMEGGRKGEIYLALKNFRNKYEALIRTRFPDIPRRVSGYNLPALLAENGFNVARALVGSENTLVTILEATLELLPRPESRVLVVLGYDDVFEAGKHVMEILKFKPIGLEGLDDILIEYLQKKKINEEEIAMLPKGKGWLLVEFGGDTKEEADAKALSLMAALQKSKEPPGMALFSDTDKANKIWKVRESALGATAWVPGEPMSVPGWEDSAVAPENISDYLKELRSLFETYELNPSLYGHFGDGCIHCRVQFNLFTEAGLEKYRRFTKEAAQLVAKYNGSISGEHGDGQARADLLEIMYGKEIVEAFREFKQIWDPQWKMNPGKKIDAYGQLSNLRISNYYNPAPVKTHFTYGKDEHSFSQATLRCVGIGNCRTKNGGTMCPSYMVTLEEKHSTRGRARLLFEMMQGDILKKKWKDESVKDALDLCLSCKGCKGDCPVSVDMATYKAEFFSHYYEGRLRPRVAYVFGWIYWWSRLASVAPRIANFFTQTPVLSSLFKKAGGIEQKRKVPEFAPETFRKWFKSRKKPQGSITGQRVILWADTFNNFFQPETLIAGVEVLEAAGFEVVVPKQMLCCGRPLYDYGMLDTAKHLLEEILETLKDEIEKGTPLVGLEPSCIAVFKDELADLFPTDNNAKRLCAQSYSLGEFFQKYAPGFTVPKINKTALVHLHCHHQATVKIKTDKELLQKTGLDFKIIDSGCCGMAGGFGYEKGQHYKVSVASGERVLLPAVRKAVEGTLLIADGFSCRSQIEQQTGKKPMHIARVLQMALRQEGKPIDKNL